MVVEEERGEGAHRAYASNRAPSRTSSRSQGKGQRNLDELRIFIVYRPGSGKRVTREFGRG